MSQSLRESWWRCMFFTLVVLSNLTDYVELYEDENYGGRVKYVTESSKELDQGFDKLTSSLKISGNIYTNIHYLS